MSVADWLGVAEYAYSLSWVPIWLWVALGWLLTSTVLGIILGKGIKGARHD